MQGAATVFHHPIHPMLVAFPIAFFIGSAGADVIFLLSRRPFWTKCALALIGFGILGWLAAATAGIIDYRTAPMTGDALDIAWDHLLVNLALISIFLLNFALRWRHPGAWFGYVLTLAGAAVVLYAGWLGGELVFRHQVDVAPVAHPFTAAAP